MSMDTGPDTQRLPDDGFDPKDLALPARELTPFRCCPPRPRIWNSMPASCVRSAGCGSGSCCRSWRWRSWGR
ncbi:hypothetical protein ACFQZC_12185 [Streptacidiphilus monticola]